MRKKSNLIQKSKFVDSILRTMTKLPKVKNKKVYNKINTKGLPEELTRNFIKKIDTSLPRIIFPIRPLLQRTEYFNGFDVFELTRIRVNLIFELRDDVYYFKEVEETCYHSFLFQTIWKRYYFTYKDYENAARTTERSRFHRKK